MNLNAGSAGHILVPTIASNGPNGLADEQSIARTNAECKHPSCWITENDGDVTDVS